MACDVVNLSSPGPFEGPEKLLEIWFASSPAHVPKFNAVGDVNRFGLRAVDRSIWEDMLEIVKCKVLSVINGEEMDAYLLSESSLFIFPHRLILKTCGTTLNLLGLPRILAIASSRAHLNCVYRCFYSRKSFMFPERQLGPHKDWRDEVEFLDKIFDNGSAYTVGKVNGDHWLLYITGPNYFSSGSNTSRSSPRFSYISIPDSSLSVDIGLDASPSSLQDYTIEVMMTQLSSRARAAFCNTPQFADEDSTTPSKAARKLSEKLGISNLFPSHLTTLDAYCFTPCGYSSNALLKWQEGENSGEGYYTIHVTPEEECSYASFECNVPLPARKCDEQNSEKMTIPDLQTLIRRLVHIFEPGRMTLTLFISSSNGNSDEEIEETAVEIAQKAFKAALTRPSTIAAQYDEQNRLCDSGVFMADDGQERVYIRNDKINYEFGGYDLAYATFEARDGL